MIHHYIFLLLRSALKGKSTYSGFFSFGRGRILDFDFNLVKRHLLYQLTSAVYGWGMRFGDF